MEKISYVWRLVGGECDIPDGFNPDLAINKIENLTAEKTSLFEKLISISKDKDVTNILKSYNTNCHNDFKLWTSLSTFVSYPRLFYEIYWPYVRRHTRRQYFILSFKSPMDFCLTQEFEIEIVKKYNDKKEIYLGCLMERVPVLKAFIEGSRESMIPFEALIERVTSFLKRQKDYDYLKRRLNLKNDDEDLKELVRNVIYESKPIFLEFNLEKHIEKKEQMIIISLSGESSLVLKESNKITENQGKTSDNKFKKYVKQLFKSLRNCISLPFDEPNIVATVFPKSSKTTCWIYAYAPPKYELSIRNIAILSNKEEKDKISYKKEKTLYEIDGNILENNAIGNPRMVSFRHGRKSNFKIRPFKLFLRIQVPQMHKSWLNSVYFALLTFLILWLFGDLYFLKYIFSGFPPNLLFDQSHKICNTQGFLQITFTLVSFIFIARNWFFHESDIYKKCSKRFVIFLLFILLFALLHTALNTIFPS